MKIPEGGYDPKLSVEQDDVIQYLRVGDIVRQYNEIERKLETTEDHFIEAMKMKNERIAQLLEENRDYEGHGHISFTRGFQMGCVVITTIFLIIVGLKRWLG